jgi:hypothetical protein
VTRELCGAWMPRARTTCGMYAGHNGRHRSESVERQRERKSAWHRERYRADPAYVERVRAKQRQSYAHHREQRREWLRARRRRRGVPENGSPEHLAKISGKAAHQWKGDSVGYEAAHHRVRKALGSASLHACVDCGGQASDWSLSWRAVAPDRVMYDERGYAYSPDGVDAYSPRCKPCHRAYDNGAQVA